MNGVYMLIYTLEEGGVFHGPRKSSLEEFEQIIVTKKIDLTPPYQDSLKDSQSPRYVEPAFIALAKVERNYDFILGRER